MRRTIAIIIGALILTLYGCISHTAKERASNDINNDEHTFLVWYNGWGGYTIWGIGFTNSPSVKCGTKDIFFTTIYDTHTPFFEESYPERKYPKNKTFAKVYNIKLQKYFKATGNECDFPSILTEMYSFPNNG